MRSFDVDRRVIKPETCAVCGASDERVLSYTRLVDGVRVTVCGSHRMAHQRSERHARSVEDLRDILRERRTGT